MIGDPSGRSSERNLLDVPTLEHNVAAIRGQLARFLDFSPGPGQALVVNNLDWLGDARLLDFLRDVGKHFTVPYMLARRSPRPVTASSSASTHRTWRWRRRSRSNGGSRSTA